MADRDNGGNRRQLSKIDMAVNKCREGATAREMLEKTVTALKEALDVTKGSNSSDTRKVRKILRISVDAIMKVVPTINSLSVAAAPIPHIGYAVQHQAIIRKLDERTLTDITNSHKRARMSFSSEPLPSTSVSGVLKELVTYTKSKSPTPKVLSHSISQKSNLKQMPSSELKSSNKRKFTVELPKSCDLPMLPPPENGAFYKPVEAYSMLHSMDKIKRSDAIKKMVEEKLIPCSYAQMYKILKRRQTLSFGGM